ncbi:class I adenylate-forming enzyme family protein [Pseudonocardia sp. WMMC193]|uniref:class I adenylate-forming enzyme family protein n=1 Tax=Pseudonocardia sp. WMMC193 TaxID=2911965 RepID=UPI001F357938|nr:AMP-binding protein [Pseudonocardia sp. WMMC193]MCF7549553.1 AMP-binding protein [Pseudonocardia sp. WMMC193]
MSGTVTDALRWWARTVPDQAAIDFDGAPVTYAELDVWADGAAAWLRSHGVRPGDRVGIVGDNSLEWCVVALAAWKLDAVACGFNHRFKVGDLRPLIELCAPTVVVADAAHHERAKEAADVPVLGTAEVTGLRGGAHAPIPRRDVEPTDPTLIVFTSGTTGTPKGVVHTHGTIAAVMHEWSLAERVEPNGMRILLVLPMFAAAGIMWGLARAVVQGGTLHLQPRFDPARALELLERERITTFTGPPILFQQIAAVPGFAQARLDSLTTAWVGGARVDAGLQAAWGARGAHLRQMYGQTETGGGCTVMAAGGDPAKCGSGGVFTRIRVVDADGVDCPPETVGEIIVRGPGVFAGYWRDEEATARALRDGWLWTGDLGVLDADGALTFVDRRGEMINSGGLKISPIEIESMIGQLPGVSEVAVFGVSDPKFGETPAAVVAGAEPADVVSWCDARLADYKVPRYVIPHDGPLPRMASGKIDKRALRVAYADAPQRFPKVR